VQAEVLCTGALAATHVERERHAVDGGARWDRGRGVEGDHGAAHALVARVAGKDVLTGAVAEQAGGVLVERVVPGRAERDHVCGARRCEEQRTDRHQK
jgi:hypothetical protein